MNIEIRDRITLNDGNAYIVVGKVCYQDRNYYYLIEATRNDSFKLCYEKAGTNILIDSEDKDINTALIPLFAEQLKPFSDSQISR